MGACCCLARSSRSRGRASEAQNSLVSCLRSVGGRRVVGKSQALAAVARRCWKHSRQKTGRPCVGLKGTVVSLPQPEQLVRVSTLARIPSAGVPGEEGRLALQALQRLGSFLNCLSWKKSCSPAVKTKSAPQSVHFRILSWNSMESCSVQPALPSHGRGSTCNCQQDRTGRPSRHPQIPMLRYISRGFGPPCARAWLLL